MNAQLKRRKLVDSANEDPTLVSQRVAAAGTTGKSESALTHA